MNDYLKFQRFHLVGIKGVAMTALALILKDFGKSVTGSDSPLTYQTEKFLADKAITYGFFDKSNVTTAQVVVYGASHQGSDNPEVKEALIQHKIVLSLSQMIGYLTGLKKTIAVSGCHGKTTTTAIISYVLEKLALDPSYLVGSAGFENLPSGKWGQGLYFVAEADEYLADPVKQRRSKFLYFSPQYIVVTNLDYDHPDFFPDFDAVIKTFTLFFKRLRPQGILIINGDDSTLLELAKNSGQSYFTYGFNKENDYQIVAREKGLEIINHKQSLIKLEPQLIGKHNQANLAAAVTLLHVLKVNLSQAAKYLNEFGGAKRRLELVAKIGQSFVYDDYAHHPTEIAASLSALKLQYPQYRLALCFQPHTYSRTKKLLPEFIKSLSSVDYLGLLPIFASAREPVDKSFDSNMILTKLPKNLGSQLLETDRDWQTLVTNTQKTDQKWIYVTMGAGDVYNKATLLIKLLNG